MCNELHYYELPVLVTHGLGISITLVKNAR